MGAVGSSVGLANLRSNSGLKHTNVWVSDHLVAVVKVAPERNEEMGGSERRSEPRLRPAEGRGFARFETESYCTSNDVAH